MRFMLGSKDPKKSRALQELKERLQSRVEGLPELTTEEKYKRALQDRKDKALEDYILGKKKGARGTPKNAQGDPVADVPLSKSKQMMLKMIQMKREARDRKALRKREDDFLKQQKQKKYEEMRLLQEEEALRQRLLEEAARQTNPDSNSWW